MNIKLNVMMLSFVIMLLVSVASVQAKEFIITDSIDDILYKTHDVISFDHKKYDINRYVKIEYDTIEHIIDITKDNSTKREYETIIKYKQKPIHTLKFFGCDDGDMYSIFKHDEYVTDKKVIISKGYYHGSALCSDDLIMYDIYEFSSYTVTKSNLLDGLVSYYKFDENTGSTAEDSTPNNNNAIITGATWTTGKINSGLHFDGTNDVVDTPLTPINTYSLSGWFKFDTLASQQMLYEMRPPANPGSTSNQFYLRLETTGKLTVGGNDGGWYSVLSSSNYSTGAWYFIVLTHDTTNGITLYVNDVQEVNIGRSGTTTESQELRIGARHADTSFFDGIADEIGWFDKVLDADERSFLYALGSPGEGQQYPFNVLSFIFLNQTNNNLFYHVDINNVEFIINETDMSLLSSDPFTFTYTGNIEDYVSYNITAYNSTVSYSDNRTVLFDTLSPRFNYTVDYVGKDRSYNFTVTDYNITNVSLSCSFGYAHDKDNIYKDSYNFTMFITTTNSLLCDLIVYDHYDNMLNESFSLVFEDESSTGGTIIFPEDLYNELTLDSCPFETYKSSLFFIVILIIFVLSFMSIFNPSYSDIKMIMGMFSGLLGLLIGFTVSNCSTVYGYLIFGFLIVIYGYMFFVPVKN